MLLKKRRCTGLSREIGLMSCLPKGLINILKIYQLKEFIKEGTAWVAMSSLVNLLMIICSLELEEGLLLSSSLLINIRMLLFLLKRNKLYKIIQLLSK